MSEIEAGKDAIQGKAPCDCPGCPDCAETAAKASVAAGPDNSRRKLLFGGVVATPAVLLLSSRPVLATGGGGYRGCTASANASVNLSKPQNVSCKGLSPGCWKETLNWPSRVQARPAGSDRRRMVDDVLGQLRFAEDISSRTSTT